MSDNNNFVANVEEMLDVAETMGLMTWRRIGEIARRNETIMWYDDVIRALQEYDDKITVDPIMADKLREVTTLMFELAVHYQKVKKEHGEPSQEEPDEFSQILRNRIKPRYGVHQG